MSSSSMKWYAHLGFQWGSPYIGSIWGNPSPDYRFLQYALAQDEEGKTPAWFTTFNQDDTLSFFVWNLPPCTPSTPTPTPTSIILKLGFSSLDAAEAYNPTDVVLVETPKGSGRDGWKYEPTYLQWTSPSFESTPTPPSSGCPWGDHYTGYSVPGRVKFMTPEQCKLSFCLKVYCGSDSQTSISDPEIIIGSNGHGNPT